MHFSYVSYISTSGITTLNTQDIFLEKIKNHANNLIGDHIVFNFNSFIIIPFLLRRAWVVLCLLGGLCSQGVSEKLWVKES